MSEELLVIDPSGGWFQRGDAARVDVRRFHAASRILAALLASRGGAGLDVEALSSAGWPDEHILMEAAADRVYQAISRLRRMGLRGRIIRREDGYVLTEPVRSAAARLPTHPGRRSSFVGRDAELSLLEGWLGSGVRLVTIIGPGGCGKTRLAQTLAGCTPGAILIELAAARDAGAMLTAVAAALALPLTAGDPVERIGRALQRQEALLILDNLEQVIESAALLIGDWLDAAPALMIVATSRSPLLIEGEQLLPLRPLSPPPMDAHDLDTVRASPAVALLLDRGRAVCPDLRLDEQTAPHLAAIARALDGLPLAIELAAARLRTRSPAALQQQLEASPDLRNPRRDVEARHRSLWASLEASWELLSEPEQLALARLSIFEGRFELDHAAAVLACPDAEVLLESLVGQSMLEASDDRYRLLVTIRAFAAEKRSLLDPDGETADRHARAFAELPAARVHADAVADLHAAALHAASRGMAREVLGAAERLFERARRHGPFAPARDLASTLMRAGMPAEVMLTLLRHRANFHLLSGDTRSAEADFRAALDGAGAHGLRPLEGQASGGLAVVMKLTGRLPEAEHLLRDAIAAARETGNARSEAINLGKLGVLTAETGRLEEAEQHYLAALSLHRAASARASEGLILANLGNLFKDCGRPEEAGEAYQEALRLHRAAGDRAMEAKTWMNLGALRVLQGHTAEARELLERSLSMSTEQGFVHSALIARAMLGGLSLSAGELDTAGTLLEQALEEAGVLEDAVAEGAVRGALGQLAAARGQPTEARGLFEAGEALLREVGHPLELGELICRQSQAALRFGEVDRAAAGLVEAEALAHGAGTRPGSPLGVAISALREAIRRHQEAVGPAADG